MYNYLKNGSSQLKQTLNINVIEKFYKPSQNAKPKKLFYLIYANF